MLSYPIHDHLSFYTAPTKEMQAYAAFASLGDDVYHEPSTVALERHIAKITGKEAGLFMPTGTMSNQIALRCHLIQPPHSGRQFLPPFFRPLIRFLSPLRCPLPRTQVGTIQAARLVDIIAPLEGLKQGASHFIRKLQPYR